MSDAFEKIIEKWDTTTVEEYIVKTRAMILEGKKNILKFFPPPWQVKVWKEAIAKAKAELLKRKQ